MRKAGIVGFASLLAFCRMLVFLQRGELNAGQRRGRRIGAIKFQGKSRWAGRRRMGLPGGGFRCPGACTFRTPRHVGGSTTWIRHAVVGDIPEHTGSTRDCAGAGAGGGGFVSQRAAGNSVTIFDLKTLKGRLGRFPPGHEPGTRFCMTGVTNMRVFAFQRTEAKMPTVIDAAEGTKYWARSAVGWQAGICRGRWQGQACT